ncbi:MAG: dipeptidase [Clostridium sp.]|nr:dipeptidase [Clostridium sp.]
MKLFDLHCDSLVEILAAGQGLDKNDFATSAQMSACFESMVQVLAIWVPPGLTGSDAWEYTARHIEFYKSELRRHEALLVPVKNGAALESLTGRLGCVLALENAAGLGGKLRNLERLAQEGVKIITLTWNGENEFAHGVDLARRSFRAAEKNTPAIKGGGGLKPLGRALLREMKAMGMAADLSHLNARGFWEAVGGDLPVLASHSNCRAVYDHPRGLSDAQLTALAQLGAPIGISFAYLRRTQGKGIFAARRDWEAICKNVTHMLELGAEKSLCFGSDYDGHPAPHGLEKAERLPLLREHLIRRGIDKKTADAMLWGSAAAWFKRTF